MTPATIHNCGYTAINTVDAISSYNKIILVHESVMTNWVGRFTIGPQINRILEKGLVSLPRLQSLKVESAVEWYDTLQKTLMIYLVPLTPLDCIMIKMGYEALCIPGTGLTHYPVGACILLELLPHLLPKTDDEVTSIINMVRMESNNGYDLLWQILELTVPGFDPTVPVTVPTWSDEGIFDFAHAFQLYYPLLSKKSDFHDDKTRSTTFLQAINDYAFADIITTLLTCINNYFSMDDDGYLPASLCIMGLAHQLNKSAKLRAKLVLPRAHHLVDESYAWQFDVPIQGSPRVCCMDAGGPDRPPPCEGHDGRDNRVCHGFIVVPQICPPPHGSCGPAVSFHLTAPLPTPAPSHYALPDRGDHVLPNTQDCGLVEAPILDHTGIRPPPEPPPIVHSPSEPIKAFPWLTNPQLCARISTPSPAPHRSLLDGIPYTIPLEKGRSQPEMVTCFPQGSLSDPFVRHLLLLLSSFHSLGALVTRLPSCLMTSSHIGSRWTV